MHEYGLPLPEGLDRPPDPSALLIGREGRMFLVQTEARLTINDFAAYHALFTRWLVEELAASEEPSSAMHFLTEVGNMVVQHKMELARRAP